MAGNAREQGRGVISRAAAILASFRAGETELSLNDVARRTGLPTSTVHRMVTQFVTAGFLERGAAGGYRIGLRLFELGSQSPRVTSMAGVVVPFMQDLYEVTHENVQCAILEGHEALYIEKVYGPRSARTLTVRGGRLPLHATGVGKVLLAHAPQPFVDEVVAAGLSRYTPHTITTDVGLRRALADVRRSGLAYAHEEVGLGLVSVAGPVYDAGRSVVAALSVVGRLTRYQMRQLAAAVRTAAASASREMSEAGMRGAGRDGLLTMLAENGARPLP